MNSLRKKKVQSQLKREISLIIMQEVKDPGLTGMVTVHEVSLTDDLKTAHVYISILGSEPQKKKSIKALEKAAGFIRSELGDRVRLQYTPAIKFSLDDTQEQRDRVLYLLKTIEDEEKKKNDPGSPD